MKDESESFEPKSFLGPVVGYYSDTQGNILSLPFNSSTPVLYYNRYVFKKAGLDPEVAPKTWKEVEEFSNKIVTSGAAKCDLCGSTGRRRRFVVVSLKYLDGLMPFVLERFGIRWDHDLMARMR